LPEKSILPEKYCLCPKSRFSDMLRLHLKLRHERTIQTGYFEAYGTIGEEPSGKYTRAGLFQEKGKRTPVFVRFSTLIHGGHSPENLRDPRGFAAKF
jgi:catalase